MSMPQSQLLTCPKCGHQQQFVIWQSLNVTLNPQEKEQLLNGSLTRFICEECTNSVQVNYPLLYHDMEKQFMIWLWPAEGNPETAQVEEHMSTYQLRIARTMNELREKVILFEQKFDDRIMEVFKWMLRTQAAAKTSPLTGELRFSHSEIGEQGEVLLFAHMKETGVFTVSVPKKAFEEVETMVGPRLPSLQTHAGKWLRVNETTVANLDPSGAIGL
jgi:hypothetical protein